MRASELIVDALRLVNIPGQGATLSGPMASAALRTLQSILNTKSVSKQFVPGIRRHFFNLSSAKSIYSYGPGGEFDTDAFDDPAPIEIEDCYIRGGSVITQNEQVDEWTFTNVGTWTVGTNWIIANGKATASGAGVISQTLGLTAGRSYTISIDVEQLADDVLFELLQDGTPIQTQTLGGTDCYVFEVGFAGVTSSIQFTTSEVTADLALTAVSIIETGLDRVSLPDGQGSDYGVRIMDQTTYNRQFSKGISGGRPDQVLYSRQFGTPEVRFDNSATAGDIIIFDVLVNRIGVSKASDEIRMNEEALRYVQYALADAEGPAYGKELSQSQRIIMRDARSDLAAQNIRSNRLRVDNALLRRRRFDINRGSHQ
jgi:hypothetical protein